MNLKSLLKKSGLKLTRSVSTQKVTPNWSTFNQRLFHRCFYLNNLYSKIDNVPGVIVECGVGQGRGLALWLSLSLIEGRNRHIWAFDSFEGFPPLVEHDEATSAFEKGLQEYHQFDIPYVLKTLLDFGLSLADTERNLSFVKGFIPDSCENYNGGEIALLYIDLDIYEGYRDSLRFFYDKVRSGGIIAFDEYLKPLDTHKWPGAAKAINEFLNSHNIFERLEICPLTGNRFIIKL